MSVIPGHVLRRIDESHGRHVEELVEFLSIPSISTYSQHAGDVRRAAEWALVKARQLGFSGALYETAGHPMVCAELCHDPGAPTLLVYGHYDVQPPEPLDQWHTPPFSPTIKDGAIYARGATDDKGQLYTYFAAVESILAAEGRLPLNVKLFIEGEEEIGSPHVEAFAEEHREMLKADVIAVSDGSKFSKDLPAIGYGLRGLVYMQVDVSGPCCDVHSGIYGGAVANPATALARILCSLKDGKGKVRIPGFYDRVRRIEPWERKEMASLPYDVEETKRRLSVDTFVPEKGYTALECMTARPTLDINGIWGGFQGEGIKTIIPNNAGAKVSMRLVPDQKSLEIARLFEEHVSAVASELPGVLVHVTTLNADDPALVHRHSPAMTVAERAVEHGFGRQPVFIREGGSIGAVIAMKRQLGVDDILMLGWGDPDDALHSPNEHFSLENFHRGTIAVAALMYGLAEMKLRSEMKLR